MSTAQVANVTDEVAVTGFIRRDLKIWFTDDYIKRTLLYRSRGKKDICGQLGYVSEYHWFKP